MIDLFHVSDGPPLATITPRPSPAGTRFEGVPLVWAVDDEHLPNYLVPRNCPRVCWVPPTNTHGMLRSNASRVVAIETSWLPALSAAGLLVHRLDPSGFSCTDASAGYWTSICSAQVPRIQPVDDCVAALEARDVELRAVRTLAPLVDAVTRADIEFSLIRMRNANSGPPR